MILDRICEMPVHYHILIIFAAQFAVMLIEAWLGRTDKTKSASILELIARTIIAVFRRIFTGGRNAGR